MSAPKRISGNQKAPAPASQASQHPGPSSTMQPTTSTSTSAGLLEVEEPDARQARLARLLEKAAGGRELSRPGQGGTSEQGLEEALERGSTGQRPGEGELPLRLGRLSDPLPTAESTSNLLSRLEAFLPSLRASNEALLERAARDPASVDIECLTAPGRSDEQEGEGEEAVVPEHIEMNLGLGVFTLRKDRASAREGEGSGRDGADESGDSSGDNDDGEEGQERAESTTSSSMSTSSESGSTTSDEEEDDNMDGSSEAGEAATSSSDRAALASPGGDGDAERLLAADDEMGRSVRPRPPAAS